MSVPEVAMLRGVFIPTSYLSYVTLTLGYYLQGTKGAVISPESPGG